MNVALAVLRATTGGTPGGPDSSTYATGATGTAAYAELLSRLGHPVRQSRVFPHQEQLTGGETAFVLEPTVVVPEDATALRAFVARGGRLVLSSPPASLRRELGSLPGVLVVTRPGRLQNARLGLDDNARYAASLGGPRGRPIVFFEAYHGYGEGRGLRAIPVNWRDALILGAIAGLVFGLARVRRFGPAEDDLRELPPARREYVEAIARTVERTSDRVQVLAPLQDELRRRVGLQAGLNADAHPEAFVAAATRLGFESDEAQAVAGPLRRGDELALGRAYAKAKARGRGQWSN